MTLTSSQWPRVLTTVSKECMYVFVLTINRTWLSMLCSWFVPLTPSEITVFEPPSPSEFPMIFPWGGGGNGYFLKPDNRTARQLHLESRLVDGLLPMQPRFQANTLLINLISNKYTIKLMVY